MFLTRCFKKLPSFLTKIAVFVLLTGLLFPAKNDVFTKSNTFDQKLWRYFVEFFQQNQNVTKTFCLKPETRRKCSSTDTFLLNLMKLRIRKFKTKANRHR